MKKIKVVLMGAGSNSFGRGTIADLMASKELNEVDLTVTLVDIDEQALDRMYKFAGLLKDYHGSRADIEATSNRLKGLPGADYVIAALSQKRYQLWEQDFLIPYAYGFKHTYGECGGPGADFHTLRSLHITVPICKDMEKLCPDALYLNFTNPENRVAMAVRKLTKIRSVGLCHGVGSTLGVISRVLGKPESDFDINIGGLNHFHWVMDIRDRSNGQDLYPLFNQKMKESDMGGIDMLSRQMYGLYGLLPFPVASHISEYVSYAYEVCGPIYMSWKEEIHAIEEEQRYGVKLISKSRIQRVVDGDEPMTDDLAGATPELAIPIICDIEFDRNRKEISVNIPNEGAIPNMPDDAIVEIPAMVNASGLHPIKVGPLPEPIAALCNKQVSIHKLLVEAYKERSKKILLQALSLEPVVDSIDRAEKMMEEMLRIEKEFLPEFR